MNDSPSVINGSKPTVAILLPNLHAGGAERVAVNLANSFAQRSYAVDMILLSATGALLADLRPDVRIVDLQVMRLRNAVFPLIRYLHKSRPNALLACMWPLTTVALLARMLAAVPARVVVAEHTTWSRDESASTLWGRWKVTNIMHYSFPGADGIVAVSNGAADDLAHFANLDRKAITVIYNPVVGEAKPPSQMPLAPTGWWSGLHRKVLAVGTLKTIKDHSTLLKAFARLRHCIDARLLILGEGNCRAALEAQIHLLGMEASVFLPGFVKDTSPYYLHADLFVLSSTGEGLPTVIIEALLAGTPVVSTDCPSGPQEILCNGQFGRLIPVGDVVALAAAMAKSLMVTHDTTALKMRAQDFSINKGVDAYEELLFPDQCRPGKFSIANE